MAKTTVTGIRLDEAQADRLRRLAESEGLTPSVLAKRCVINYLERGAANATTSKAPPPPVRQPDTESRTSQQIVKRRKPTGGKGAKADDVPVFFKKGK